MRLTSKNSSTLRHSNSNIFRVCLCSGVHCFIIRRCLKVSMLHKIAENILSSYNKEHRCDVFSIYAAYKSIQNQNILYYN